MFAGLMRLCERVPRKDEGGRPTALLVGSRAPQRSEPITVARSGGEAMITALDRVEDALAGNAGTRISGA